MIYLDNAATTYPKPMCVIRACEEAMITYGANPGRAGHRLSMITGEKIWQARTRAADLFSASAENVIFTPNCTSALNTAIKGFVKAVGKCHIITTDAEHNSVIRPVYSLFKEGKITYDTAKCGENEDELLYNIQNLINKDTRAIVMTSGCNVTGRINPFKRVAGLCRKNDICLILDCAQSAGVIPLSLSDGVNIICAPGHKGLYGPMGTGIMITDGKYPLKPLMEGGTGSHSQDIAQPDFLPDMLESGTVNTPGIIGLSRGIEFVLKRGINNIYSHEQSLCELFLKLCQRGNIITYRKEGCSYLPVVAFNIPGKNTDDVTEYLSDKGFYLRGGLHCNSLAHRSLGTLKTGAVRLSPSVFNTKRDIVRLYDTLMKM